MIVGRPFEELEYTDELWSEPKCRMPDYAACVSGTAFGTSLLASCLSRTVFPMRHNPWALEVVKEGK